MSQEAEALVARCVRLLNERDEAGIEEAFDPEVVIDLSRNVFNPDVYRGYDGVRRYVRSVEDAWDDFSVRLDELIPAGDAVVTRVTVTARGRMSGVAADMEVLQVWRLRQGRVVEFVGGLRTREEALDFAAGGGG